MTLSEELTWRGFVNQTTLKDLSVLNTKPGTFYLGFDASADSQTVGNLAAMMFAKTFLRHKWKGILLAGGSTSLIGDPGGKDKERPLQDEATVAHNVAQAGAQIKQVLRGHQFKLVNNLDWTKDLRVIPFLRDIGKHFSMTPLVQRDYIAKRLGEGGSGISYAEFSYTILQGMDYLHLFDTEGVTLQLGGSDQWGNCLSGVELIRRARGAEVDVITLNLIMNAATGKKFGKSEEGAVWLDPAKTTPSQFYQFWMNADDEGLETYLKVFTELSKPDIDHILEQHALDTAARSGQQQLAHAVTINVHGEEQTALAEAISHILMDQAAIGKADKRVIEQMSKEYPFTTARVGSSVVETLVAAGLAASNSEARRLLSEGGVYINGHKVEQDTLKAADFQAGHLLLRRGKAYKDTALVALAN